METKEFELRPYLKKELAKRYFPSMNEASALRKLQKWIKEEESNLHDRLYDDAREGRNDHFFTRRQVALIVEAFGTP
ncbi:MAG: DUF4248 domain-containing protein [Bacteroides sp.]|nr:DUF4248 domain-containing protein [Bacteroides sp.]MBQ8225751.1 DUF4248 domain-containing protein [Bacteroides sp.]